jgi:NADPH:quinone reductase-like Zn-dependent oxidoreductase
MRTIGLSVPARKAAHEPEEDMRLRVMALAASVLAIAAVSTVSHVNGSFRYGVRSVLYVDVTTVRLDKIADLFDRGRLVTDVGTLLPLEDARIAHEMRAGRPHRRGKIVLNIDSGSRNC